MFALLSLLACGPTAPAYTPDLSAYAGSEAACLQKHCGTAADADAFGACRVEKCATVTEAWAVNPTLLRYDKGVVTMSVQVEHTAGGHGDQSAPADTDTFLGATVITSSGEEIDMAVQTVFADRLSEPFTFSSEVGEGVEAVIVGLWGDKIEPCDSTRSGCQMFGFVLDESLAAWPEGTYSAEPMRQRFLPAEMKVSVAAPPKLPEAEHRRVEATLKAFTEAEGTRFGSRFVADWTTYTYLSGSSAETPPAAPAGSTVEYKHVHDGPVAKRLAAALAGLTKEPMEVRHHADSDVDLAILLGADACPAGLACR